jgi:hypothetical protein
MATKETLQVALECMEGEAYHLNERMELWKYKSDPYKRIEAELDRVNKAIEEVKEELKYV